MMQANAVPKDGQKIDKLPACLCFSLASDTDPDAGWKCNTELKLIHYQCWFVAHQLK